jgi:Rieske Fe-S protein
MRIDEIPVNEGKSGKIGAKYVAVYNDNGNLLVMENVCTHRGCQTGWNSAEKTWDCPCHGSRYHADGTVLRGPAPRALPRLNFRIEGNQIKLQEVAS